MPDQAVVLECPIQSEAIATVAEQHVKQRAGEQPLAELRAARDVAFEEWQADVAAGRRESRWQFFSPSEPQWLRLDRLMRCHGVDDAVPQEWVDAARSLLDGANAEYEGHLGNILKNPVLHGVGGFEPPINVWATIDAQFDQLKEQLGTDPGRFDFRRPLLLILMTKGGSVPGETDLQRQNRRREIAKAARNLAELMSLEPELRFVTASDMAKWADPRFDAVFSLHQRAAFPHIDVLLRALADRLHADERLHFRDSPSSSFAPQPGRRDGQRILLERRLCDFFETFLHAPRGDLVAPLIVATLTLDETLDRLTPSSIESRWRNWKADG